MIPHDASIDDDGLPPDLYPIRLQGPWRVETLYGDAGPKEFDVLKLPLAESTPAPLGAGPLRLSRNFQRPTNLDPEERVLLVLPPGCRPSAVVLNDAPLDAPRRIVDRSTWDLTLRLKPSNQLRLEFDSVSGDSLAMLRSPVLLGIMPDADGSWWAQLPEVDAR